MQPSINLAEPGFNLQLGMRPTTWVTLGFDYAVASGQNTLEPTMLLHPCRVNSARNSVN